MKCKSPVIIEVDLNTRRVSFPKFIFSGNIGGDRKCLVKNVQLWFHIMMKHDYDIK